MHLLKIVKTNDLLFNIRCDGPFRFATEKVLCINDTILLFVVSDELVPSFVCS